jgi:hypothetical protein
MDEDWYELSEGSSFIFWDAQLLVPSEKWVEG